MKNFLPVFMVMLWLTFLKTVAQDAAPEILWENKYKTTDNYFRTERVIRSSDGGLVVVGETGLGAMLTGIFKTGTEGEQQWKKIFGSDSSFVRGNSIYNLPNGNIAFVGTVARRIGSVIVNPFIYVVESALNSTTITMQREYDGTLGLKGNTRVVPKDTGYLGFGITDNIYEPVAYLHYADSDTKKVWQKEIPMKQYFNDEKSRNLGLYSVSNTPDGGLMAMCSRMTSTDLFGALLLKFSSEGEIQFGKIFKSEPGYPEKIIPQSVITTSDGGYGIVFSSYQFSAEVPNRKYTSFVKKLNSSGEVVWTKEINKGDSTNTTMNFILEMKDGSFLVAGGTGVLGGQTGTKPKTQDNLLVKLNKDGEQIWEKKWGNPNVDERLEYILEESDGYVLAGAVGEEFNRELWLAKVNLTTTDVAENLQAAEKFMLSPNPAQSSSSIHYILSAPANVKIEVVDALGNIISTPFSGFKTEGEYSVPFTTQNIPSGMYSVRMTSNGRISTQSLSVVK